VGVTLTIWALIEFAVLGLLGFGIFWSIKQQVKTKPTDKKTSTSVSTSDSAPMSKADAPSQPVDEATPYKISYVPSSNEWSGGTSGPMPLKILTYKQYECLEDARYGFKIVGVTPTERKKEQPHKTRAHSLKTVGSLARHGFLADDGEGGHIITDHGLNALQVCSVRY
jgi:hypothetical protein